MLKVAIMLCSPPKYLFSIEIEISAIVVTWYPAGAAAAIQPAYPTLGRRSDFIGYLNFPAIGTLLSVKQGISWVQFNGV